MKRTFIVIVTAAALSVSVVAQQPSSLEVVHVRGNIYVVFGAGANITVSAGKDGMLLVDTGTAEKADAVVATLQQVQKEVEARTDAVEALLPRFGAETRSTVVRERDPDPPAKPVRYIVNTAADADRIGGNETLAASGRTFTGGNVAGDIRDAAAGAAILAHENVLVRMSTPPAGQPAASSKAMPTDTYYVDAMNLSHFFNGEGVRLIHVPSAHSDGDSIVVFRGADVIAAGEIFSTDTYPVIDVDRGGTINGVIDGLNRIIDLTFAEFRTEGGTMIVPGHGRLADTADVAYYRDMVTIIRDRVQDMVNRKMTLEQIKAARPTADYEPRYGATRGRWTTDQFIEAVYRSLQPRTPRAPAATPRGRT